MTYAPLKIPSRLNITPGAIPNYHLSNGVQRPETFEIDYDHFFAKDLVLAGLGSSPGSLRFINSAKNKIHGDLASGMDPKTDWVLQDRCGVNFAAGHDYVGFAIGTYNKILKGASQITVSAKIFPTAASANMGVVIGTMHGGNANIWVSKYTDNKIYYGTRSKYTDAFQELFSAETISLNTLTTISGVFDYSGSITIYINGKFSAVNSSCTFGSTTFVGDGSPGYTDRIGNSASDDRDFVGNIFDVMIHTRKLTLREIELYADPSNLMYNSLIKQVKPQLYRGVTLDNTKTLTYQVKNGNDRPEYFEINQDHIFAKNLLLAGLCGFRGTIRYHNFAPGGPNGTLTNLDTAVAWKYNEILKRRHTRTDGVDGYITIPLAMVLPFTATFWLWNPGNTGGSTGAYVSQGGETTGWNISRYYNDGYIRFTCGSRYGHVAGAWTPAPTKPVHFTLNGLSTGYFTSWRDGTIIDNNVYTYLPWTSDALTTIGANSVPGQYALADIADLMIWNITLPQGFREELDDPTNTMLSGLIKESGPKPLRIKDRHWVGRTTDWNAPSNWSTSQGGKGGASVPQSDTNVYFDSELPVYE